jgi:CBS domain containing-hemolysin-like protein
MDPVVHLSVIGACLVLSAFFSGSETALMRLRAHEYEGELRAGRNPAAVAVRNLLDSTSRLLVTILIGNNVVNILGAALASAMAVYYLGERQGVAVATISMTLLVLIFSEILPKAVAARSPRRFAFAVALPLYLVHRLFKPAHLFFGRFVEPVLRRIGGGADEGLGSSEELLRMARALRHGAARGTPLAIIGGVSRAAELTASDIMVPRTEITAFSKDTPASECLERVLEERYTRVPIYDGSIDRFVGLVHLKDLMAHVRAGGTDLTPIVKPILRVPESKPILELLADMQRAFIHMAAVKDEFGVTEGLVTMEDVIEELVSEIRDEFDREELSAIQERDDGSFDVLGRVKVLDFNRDTGLAVPGEPGDTLGGIAFNALGRPPRQGESVSIGGYELKVMDASGSRVALVRVTPRPESERRSEDERLH